MGLIRRLIPVALIVLVSAALWAAQPSAPSDRVVRLIVQGDDLGVGHGVNEATLQAYRDGILRTANVIVPGPWLLEAAEIFRDNPGLDAGVHLAITSEWSSVKWRPLTSAPSFVDENGYFLPMVWPNPALPPHSSLKEASPRLPEIERELRAQIEMARRLIPQLTYASEHMGFGSLSPEIRDLVSRLTKAYGLVIPGPEIGVQFVQDVWSREDGGAARSEKLAAMLETLGPGTWVMVELSYWGVRDGASQQWPPVAHRGPKVMLINGWSGSGGDAFPFYFREAQLGPLIGTRTWGGLIGISGSPDLIDGGGVTVPTFRMYDPKGQWFAEGHGVDPDIRVDEDPTAQAKGTDAQLERAIEEVMSQLKSTTAAPSKPAYERRVPSAQ